MKHSKEQLLSMDSLEYAEKVLNLKLTKWQKRYIRDLQNYPIHLNDVFKANGSLYGHRACYLVYERWKNRIREAN